MTKTSIAELNYLPEYPIRRDVGIGVVGAGFIVRDCHLVAYANAGFRVLGITSRTRATAEEVAELRGVPRVHDTVEAMLEDPEIEVIDLAVPPMAQPTILRTIARHPRKVRGVLAQKPLAMTLEEARSLVDLYERAGILLQVNQNMRFDHSVRAAKSLIVQGRLGDVVLATIEMRAIPHWMDWANDGRSLSTFLMSIHHLDTFRYWLGDPVRVLASTRPDPRTKFAHADGINLVILEYDRDLRASCWDDVWNGPAREGAASDLGIRWRIEGTEGIALGTIGWPSWPAQTPSTLDYSTSSDNGMWHHPRWPQSWFPDAFAGTMCGLLCALESGTEPDIPGRDNLKTIALCEAVFTGALAHRVVNMSEFSA